MASTIIILLTDTHNKIQHNFGNNFKKYNMFVIVARFCYSGHRFDLSLSGLLQDYRTLVKQPSLLPVHTLTPDYIQTGIVNLLDVDIC